MKILTLTTGVGVVTPLTITYVPEAITFVAATQLTGFKATVLGEGVICDLDADGLSSLGRQRQIGAVTNGYRIPLADGLIKNKNLELIFTNSAAQTPDIYAQVTNQGTSYIQSMRQKALANSGIDISKFMFAGFPAGAATDQWNITFREPKLDMNGEPTGEYQLTTQKFERAELQQLLAMTQSLQNSAYDYCLDNYLQTVELINFIPAADQTVYITKVM